MRYYSIIISDPDSGAIVKPKSLAGLSSDATYTSFVNGVSLPGALNVELDIQVYDLATPNGASWVRVWGISLEEIGQANDLVGKSISVFAGMQKGLPLAKPKQAGLILQGSILKSWGNWIGTDQTLDMIVVGALGSQAAPKNLIHNWKKGTPLADAITSTLKTAFPKYTVNVAISSKLILAEDDVGYYHTAGQYAQYVQEMSRSIIGGNYPGVYILLAETTFSVYDLTATKTPIAIAFEDLIGQPTWIDPQTVQFKCAMRHDITVGDFITFPKDQNTSRNGQIPVTTTVQSALPFGDPRKSKSIFQGTFYISEARHLGNFRQPDAASWVSVFNASAVDATGGVT